MTQYDFGIIDPLVKTGTDLATMLNSWRDATYTMQRGPTRPAFVVPGQMWVNDSGGAANWVVNVFVSVAAGDKPLWKLNTTTGKVIIASGIDFEAAPKWPTPPSTQNDTTGATTEWVNSKLGGGTVVQYQSIHTNQAQGPYNISISSPMLVTEGVQVAQLTFTPKSTSNKVTIKCHIPYASGSSFRSSIFWGSVNEASSEAANFSGPFPAVVSFYPGATTPVLAQCRIGGNVNILYTSTFEITEYSS